MSRGPSMAVTAVVAALAAGCCLKQPPPPRSLDRVLSGHNQHVASVPLVYSPRMRLSGELRPAGQLFGQGYDLDASLIYRPPFNFRLVGNVAGVDLLGMGANRERYWLFVKGNLDTLWWGYQANIGKAGVAPIALRPDDVVEALGLAPLPPANANLEYALNTTCTHEKVNVYAYDPRPRTLLWLIPLSPPDPRGWRTRVRQYSFDRFTRDLVRVREYDDRGTLVIREARLDGYRVVEPEPPAAEQPVDPDLAWMGVATAPASAPAPTSAPATADGPAGPVRLPSRIQIEIRDLGPSGSASFALELGRVRLNAPGLKAAAFDFPSPPPTGTVIFIDAAAR